VPGEGLAVTRVLRDRVGVTHAFKAASWHNTRCGQRAYAERIGMDKRVDCMACLVADENGMKVGVVTRAGITHALSKAGLYYTARVYEEDVV
jgi:hypothetical protein